MSHEVFNMIIDHAVRYWIFALLHNSVSASGWKWNQSCDLFGDVMEFFSICLPEFLYSCQVDITEQLGVVLKLSM